ncbi:DUF6056 family protein [Vagococcus vulneris]|uniref:Glycosyltransferase RgtA/B/C/D-like domain-containing protein n=1 Tax=Vagococcus vulneris TaxID=1977869 RepID=A0A430A1K3_9ENTE|nr:DUF6056 family protein [Vagococcus vulneris]RSU00276.1 hypothetical protein CBF37_02975 [Vagococcus vulneris]
MLVIKNKYHIIELCTLICLIFFFFILNYYTWYGVDDLFYKFFITGQFTPENSTSIKSLSEFIISQRNHYLIMNGRIMAHVLLQFVMQFNKLFFDSLNTVVILMISYLIPSISSNIANEIVLKKYPSLLSMIICLWLIFMQTAEMSTTYFWVSGSINYVWGALFGLILVKIMLSQQKHYLLIGFLSFFVGNYSENNGPGFIFFASMIYIVLMIQRTDRFLYVKPLISIISGFVGFMVLMFAPRTMARGNSGVSFQYVIANLSKVTTMLIDSNLLVYLFLLFSTLWLIKDKENIKNVIILLTVFICHIFTVLPLIFSPEIYYRSFFGSQIILYIAVIFMIDIYNNNFDFISLEKNKILCIILVFSFLSFWPSYKSVKEVSKQTDEIIVDVMNQKKKGKENVTVANPTNLFPDKRTYVKGVSDDKNGYLNIWTAKYFGVKTISADPKKTSKLNTNRLHYHHIEAVNDNYMDMKRWQIEK